MFFAIFIPTIVMLYVLLRLLFDLLKASEPLQDFLILKCVFAWRRLDDTTILLVNKFFLKNIGW